MMFLPSAKHTCSTSPNSPTVNLPEQKRGDYPTTQDPEIAHSEPQEGAKLAEEDKLPTVVIHDGWKCPYDKDSSSLLGRSIEEARDLWMCYCCDNNKTCEGPKSTANEPEHGTDESEEGAA